MKTDAEFVADLKRSHAAVCLVERLLRDKGLCALAQPTKIMPIRQGYQDFGDIHIMRRVEVKHRKIEFSGSHDYPFATIFVDEVYKADNPDKGSPPLAAYVIVNASMTHAAIITAATRKHWVIERRFDPS